MAMFKPSKEVSLNENINFKITPAMLKALLEGDLANALISATPGAIELQEASGQNELIENAILPIDIRRVTKAELETLGFRFGKKIDSLFQEATLPLNWTKINSETSSVFWSHIIDDSGQIRARIFYKAAFYDRHAFMDWCG
jgi:hypothetical protein